MSFVFPFILIMLKYCVFIFKSNTIKILHHLIQEDWKIMQSKLEYDIMEKHTYDCQNNIISLFRIGGVLFTGMVVVQFSPIIFDFILPLDEPRSRKTLITVEYFIPLDNIFYTAVIHEVIVAGLLILILITTGTQLLLCAHHSFGMFKIARHRMEHSIDERVLRMPNCHRVICEKIFHVVIAHRRAMELVPCILFIPVVSFFFFFLYFFLNNLFTNVFEDIDMNLRILTS
ncbi:hypothetical protein PUN28_005053 [Cardiocondyla obscurior]|uniref:Uncharacterized protein n=1 Tax=Cardiocondyla obscurior TaxID=286306 RepID=A0AAW2GFS7_9HYME